MFSLELQVGGYPDLRRYGEGMWNSVFPPRAQAIFDGQGDTSVCEYYDEMAKKNKNCSYYPEGALICRGKNSSVNAMMGLALKVEFVSQGKSLKHSEVLSSIRRKLVASDKAAQAAGKVDQNGCMQGNEIDAYHDKAFKESGISERFYGGNRWPQGVPPNPVSLDPSAPWYSPGQIFK